MNRNFSAKLQDLNGQDIHVNGDFNRLFNIILKLLPRLPPELAAELMEEVKSDAGQPLDLAEVAVGALISAYEDEKTSLTDTDRVGRMELARRLHKKGVVDVSTAEIELIKKLVTKRFGGVMIPVLTTELLNAEPAQDVKPAQVKAQAVKLTKRSRITLEDDPE